jgi:hypothetical protein
VLLGCLGRARLGTSPFKSSDSICSGPLAAMPFFLDTVLFVLMRIR